MKPNSTARREHQRRRRRLAQMMDRDSIAILPTAPVSYRNRDIEHPYRPDSDFLYLTGFDEPQAVAVLMPGQPQGEFLLFCRERDVTMEMWTGPRAGSEGACVDYDADDAYSIDQLDEVMPTLLENRGKIYYTMGCDPEFDRRVTGWLKQIRRRARSGVHPPDEIASLEHLVHEMRLFKGRHELKHMRRAARISAAAHRRAMEACRPGMREYELEAEMLHEFVRHGARSPAYPLIIGGGANACVLHYTANEARLNEGDLVLIDAGAEYQSYAADITRTFPVGGRFSDAQRAIYELVLSAQRAAIDKVRPGNHWNDPHDAAVRTLTRGLVRLGLLKGDVRSLIRKGAYQRFFVHRTGHWLGMDVHDVGDYKVGDVWRLLEPGMVMTVEPGIYIPAGSKGVAKKWWNIGVRIEDDVLVTRDGHEILSADVPKDTAEVEQLAALR